MSVSLDTPVVLLHGLGPQWMTSASLWPLEMYLRMILGFKHTSRVRYNNNARFECMLNEVDNKISVFANKSDPIVVIGQSMGGVIANSLHAKGWNVSYAIYIGSPLHGAELLNMLNNTLPQTVKNLLHKVPYDFLMAKGQEREPPHDYHTFSMSWPFTEFDGCVFKNEATLDKKNHTHLPWADHRTIFLNPRLMWHVGRKLGERLQG